MSRRSVMYTLHGLSFREFLYFEDIVTLPSFSLEDILDKHTELASDVVIKIKVLPAFHNYLQYGYYPFYKEGQDVYYDRLSGIVSTILENDLPSVVNLQHATILKFKRLLTHVASLVPYTPNINDLSGLIETDRKSLLGYLQYLDRAELILQLYSGKRKLSELTKPSKLYMENTNLLFALSRNTQSGTLRETFFANQMSCRHELAIPTEGDFVVNDTYVFEVGGKGKTFRQIRNIPNSYVAYDDMEIGLGNKIPLWMFGLQY